MYYMHTNTLVQLIKRHGFKYQSYAGDKIRIKSFFFQAKSLENWELLSQVDSSYIESAKSVRRLGITDMFVLNNYINQ